jgi:hypothetical protein
MDMDEVPRHLSNSCPDTGVRRSSRLSSGKLINFLFLNPQMTSFFVTSGNQKRRSASAISLTTDDVNPADTELETPEVLDELNADKHAVDRWRVDKHKQWKACENDDDGREYYDDYNQHIEELQAKLKAAGHTGSTKKSRSKESMDHGARNSQSGKSEILS